jgi:DUF971 family protein
MIYRARFYNCGEYAVAIVAVVNYHNDVIYDWAAYIGYGTSQQEEKCYAYVAEHGNKLNHEDAFYYFPYLPQNKWRS